MKPGCSRAKERKEAAGGVPGSVARADKAVRKWAGRDSPRRGDCRARFRSPGKGKRGRAGMGWKGPPRRGGCRAWFRSPGKGGRGRAGMGRKGPPRREGCRVRFRSP